MQHIDIMPTLLGMLDYDKPYFAFGKNHFNKEEQENHFAINFSNSALIVQPIPIITSSMKKTYWSNPITEKTHYGKIIC